MSIGRYSFSISLTAAIALAAMAAAHAQTPSGCPVNHDQLVQAFKQSVKPSGAPNNGDLDNNEWAAVVGREDQVCAVAFSGAKATDQWLGSRAIAVEKADTANAFALDAYAISTANLWGQAQPGAPLFGLPQTSPPLALALYAGSAQDEGTAKDPLVGKRVGGVAFGGGLALYDAAIMWWARSASAATRRAPITTWRGGLRQKLKLDNVPAGPGPANNDCIIYDVSSTGKSASGWGHPQCGHNAAQVAKEIGSGLTKSTETEPSIVTGRPPGTPPAAQ